jgi:hypothetical protein
MKPETIGLNAAATYVLEECRMVLPGIQALFGFQLIAVFSDGFSASLSAAEQALHLAAIVLVVSAIALVMAPAALHRQSAQYVVTERFVWLSSRLVLAGMLPLALGLCADLYLVGRVILGSPAGALALAAAVLALIVALWVVLPRRERHA